MLILPDNVKDYPTNSFDERVIAFKLDSKFNALLLSARKQYPDINKGLGANVHQESVCALDPGETTGVAFYDGVDTIWVTQKRTINIGPSYDWLHTLLEVGPYDVARGEHWGAFKHLRYEDYRIYQWKAEDHAWSPVHTIRWIGAIQIAAYKAKPQPLTSCVMAQQAKAWWTDEKLNMFGLNPKGLRHGRDALRHLLFYLLFPTKVDKN